MDYLEFLRQPFNLPFVGVIVLGVVAWLVPRGGRGPGLLLSPAFLLTTGVVGLTINGAIHDLGLGEFGRRFPAVLLVAGGLGAAMHALSRKLGGPRRDREVRFNDPGLAGETAIVLSRPTPERGAGRARVRGGDRVTHIVRIEADPDAKLHFAARVRLADFDADANAYRVERL